MAMVACRECGKLVSHTAKACPSCGKQNPAPLPPLWAFVVAGGLVALLVWLNPSEESHRETLLIYIEEKYPNWDSFYTPAYKYAEEVKHLNLGLASFTFQLSSTKGRGPKGMKIATVGLLGGVFVFV